MFKTRWRRSFDLRYAFKFSATTRRGDDLMVSLTIVSLCIHYIRPIFCSSVFWIASWGKYAISSSFSSHGWTILFDALTCSCIEEFAMATRSFDTALSLAHKISVQVLIRFYFAVIRSVFSLVGLQALFLCHVYRIRWLVVLICKHRCAWWHSTNNALSSSYSLCLT